MKHALHLNYWEKCCKTFTSRGFYGHKMSMRASQRLLKLQESPESFVDNEYMHQIIAELLINSDLTHPSLLLICSLGGEELSSSCTQKKKQVRKLH